jgi:hypothetical protein
LDEDTALHRRCGIHARMPSSPHTLYCGGASTCAHVSVHRKANQRSRLSHTAPLTRRHRALPCSLFCCGPLHCIMLCRPGRGPHGQGFGKCQRMRLKVFMQRRRSSSSSRSSARCARLPQSAVVRRWHGSGNGGCIGRWQPPAPSLRYSVMARRYSCMW